MGRPKNSHKACPDLRQLYHCWCLQRMRKKNSCLVQGFGFKVCITCQPVIACTKSQLDFILDLLSQQNLSSAAWLSASHEQYDIIYHSPILFFVQVMKTPRKNDLSEWQFKFFIMFWKQISPWSACSTTNAPSQELSMFIPIRIHHSFLFQLLKEKRN